MVAIRLDFFSAVVYNRIQFNLGKVRYECSKKENTKKSNQITKS